MILGYTLTKCVLRVQLDVPQIFHKFMSQHPKNDKDVNDLEYSRKNSPLSYPFGPGGLLRSSTWNCVPAIWNKIICKCVIKFHMLELVKEKDPFH